MKPKSCLAPGDIASTKAAIKENPPISSGKQKLIEKQEKMFYALDKDVGFQKSIANIKLRVDKITAIQKKYADNGVKIARKKINKMMKNGVTVAKPKPVVIPKPPPVVAPAAPKPPVIIPKPPPKIVSIPKEPVPKIIPPKPVSKEFLTEFKPAKTLEEASKEWGRHFDFSTVPEHWDTKKKLEMMNSISAEMNNLQKWTRGRKLGTLKFGDGKQTWVGLTNIDRKMKDNVLELSHRNFFMKPGFGEKGFGSLTAGRESVCKSIGGPVFRHEMGHVFWYDAKAKMRPLTSEFAEKFSSTKKVLIKNNISTYATTDVEEFFAETFAVYSSPQYKVGSLNKVFGKGFEELMEKILVGGS